MSTQSPVKKLANTISAAGSPPELLFMRLLQSSSYRVLEQRMVFDGAAAATVNDAADSSHDNTPDAPVEQATPDAGGSPDAGDVVAALASAPVAPADAGTVLIFVDANVSDPLTLVDAASHNGQVIVLDPNRDGVEQIAEVVSQYTNVDAIHIVSHGAEGVLYLGSSVLDAASMQGEYLDELTAIGQALSADGDILIYGCNFTGSDAGLEAAIILGGITGADIAASTDDTGSEILGGDWVLESQFGTIDASAIEAADWVGLLAPGWSITGTTSVSEGANASYTISLSEPVPAGSSVSVDLSLTDVSTLPADHAGFVAAVNAAIAGRSDLSFDGTTLTYTAPASTTYTTAVNTVTPTSIVGQPGTTTVSSITNSDDATATAQPIGFNFNFYGTNYSTLNIDTNGYVTFGAQTTSTFTNAALGTALNGRPAIAAYWDDLNPAVAGDVYTQLSGAPGSRQLIVEWNAVPRFNNGTDGGTIQLILREGSNEIEFRYIDVDFAGNNSAFDNGSSATIGIQNGSGAATQHSFNTASVTANTSIRFSAPTATFAPLTINLATVDDATVEPAQSYQVTLSNPQSSVLAASTSVTTTINDNDALVATADSYSTAEDATLTVGASGVLANDSAVEGVATATLISGPSHGTLTFNSDGSFVYSPDANYSGSDSFTYQSSLGGTSSNVATVSINVTPVNDAPVANGDTFATASNSPVAIDVLSNDSDVDSPTLTVTQINGTSITAGGAGVAVTGGAVVLNADGTLTFTPNANYSGSPSFTYTVSDGSGGTANATVSGAVSASPIIDLDGDPAATLTVSNGGVFFQPSVNAGVDRTNTLTFVVPADGLPDTTRVVASMTTIDDTFRISVNGTSISSGNIAVDVGGVGPQLTFADGTNVVTGWFANVNGLPRLEVRMTESGIQFWGTRTTTSTVLEQLTYAGTLTFPDFVAGTNTIVITNVNASGPEAVNGVLGATVQRTAYSTTFKENAAAVAIADTDAVITDSDDANIESATITLTNAQSGDRLLVNGSAVATGTLAGGAITYVISGNTVSLTGSATKAEYAAAIQAIQFDNTTDLSAAGQSVDRLITVTVSDGTSVSNTAVSTIVIDLAPDPANDAFSGNEDMPLSGNVLANDTDVGTTPSPASPLAVSTGPAHGTLASFDTATGAFVYTPGADFNGVDTFVYSYTDANGDSRTATVTLTVTPVDDASDDAYTTAEDTAVSGDVSANDTFSGAVTYAVATGPAHGSLVFNADGTFTYTPAADFNGVDTFTYTATDVNGVAETQTVTLTVTPVDDASDDAYTTAEDTAVGGDVSANDTFSGAVTYALGSGPAHGSLVFNADGSFTYTPAADFNGVDTFTYTATDVNGVAETQTVTLTVTPVDDAADDAFTTAEDTAVSGDVSVNDTFSGAVTYAVATGPAHGGLVFNADGSFTYTPAADFNGVDTFTYTATDVNGVAETQTVTLTVTPVDDASDDAYTTAEDTAVGGDVSVNDTFSGAVTYALGSGPAHGGLVFNADGSFTYTPAADFNGGDSFTYTATDVNGVAETQTVTLTVTPVDDASDDAYTTAEDTAVGGDVSVNDTFSGAVTYALGSGPAHGGLVFNADGSFTYTPAADFNGVDTFVYSYTDANGDSRTATVTLTVTPVDDASDDAYTTAEDTAVSGDVSANDTFSGAVTYAVATGPAHGSLVFNADGTFTYTPAADFNGVDTFTYTATDVNGVAETQTVTLTVTPVDDASDDAYTTAEDTAVGGDVSANDTFSGAVTYALGSGPAHGSLVFNADGSFTYTPAADFNGVDTFTYTATDVNGVAETQTVTLTVTPVDDAADDAFTTAEDTAVSGDVSVNDTYAGAVAYALGSGPAHGTVILAADGSFTYTPAADFNGVDTFTYTATDVNGVAETQTVTLTVTPVDDASDDAYTTAEDTAVSGDVSANDTYAGAVTYAVATGPAHGTVILAADGSFTYTPAADFNGVDSFTYTATDVNGVAETQTVTLTVTPVDDASDDAFTTAEDTAVSGDVSANDTYAGAVTYAVAAGPAHGSLVFNADGTFTYTPAADFNGVDTFTYTATDVNGVAETQTVTLTVTPVDDAADDAFTTAEDTAVGGDVSVNDTFSGAVTYALGSGPAHGTVILAADGSFTYTPAADFNGVDSFTYTATDVNGVAETQTVTLTVTPVDDASDDAYTTAEDTPVSGDVSANDTYAGAVTYAVATSPAHGSLVFNADGSFTYTPAADFNGVDSFTYTATDANGVAETQTVTLTVTPVDDASDDAYTTAEDTAVSGDVSINDTYAGAVTYAVASGPAHGSLVFNADGSFTYTPAADFNGVDTFTYTATDVNGVAETQTVTLTVTPDDDASDDAYTTAEDTAVSGDVSVNDTYAGAVTYAVATGPAHGTVILAADGTFTYTPAADFNGVDTFTYTATDVNGVAETQTVTLTVTPVDDASDDAYTTAEDTAVGGDVSANDTFSGAVTYALATGPAHGTVILAADGSFTYTPAADFNGVDTFTYTATDVNGVAETQTVTLTVTPVDDASDDAFTTAEDTPVSGDVSANDTYAGAVTYAVATSPAHGGLVFNADGSFTYTPAADFNGVDSFTYTATDVNGVAETQTVTLTVTPVDDAADDAFTTAEDTAVGGDVSVNDTFSGAVTYAVATGPAHGTVILAADGTFTYTPAADFNGVDSFTYTATDVNGVAETQTVTLTVTPVDDASDDALTTAEDTAVSGDVSVNDTYTGAVTYAVAAGPAHGSLVFNADGSFTYTPAADFNGVDSFTYTATDVNGVAETQTVTLTVTPVDDAADDAFTTAEDTAVGGDVSVNDTFSGAVTYAVATGPAHGTVILAADGTFTYTPAADFNGVDSFTYTATDVNGVAETQTVTLTVTPVDDASDDALTTAEDTAVSGDVSVNDTYTGAVTYAVAAGPAHGSLVFNADGSFTYTPAADFNGVDSFTYTATDVNGVAETQTVTLTVTPVDDAADDAFTTAEDTAVGGDVSVNDTFSGAVTYAVATGPAHGTVILAADGTFTYTPAADFNGVDSFTYTATDVNGVAETQTVTLTVTPVDDASDDALTTAEDTAVSGDVSVNDTYTGAVTYAVAAGPAHGSLVFNADGSFTYTPAADFNGVDSFTYTATDVNGVAETQTVTLTVTPVDDASDDAYTTAEDTAVSGDVSVNDTFSGAVTYAVATGPAHGSLVFNADGSFTYTPAADFNGVDTFTYTATDVNGVAETQTVTLTVTPVDDAADDAFTTAEDTAVSGDVSANDTYAGAVTYAVATGPAHGTVILAADGSFTYTPAADFNGVDTFTYTATDVNGVAETQTVTLTVTPVDDASDDAFTTAEDTAVSGDVSVNDTYAGAVTYAVATGPAHGSLVFNADGTFTYTPAADFNGVDSFTYTATDVNGVAETQTVTLTVTPVDDASDDALTTAEDTAVGGDVSANDTFSGAVTYAVATGPAHGSLVFNADGSFIYTPAADFNGVDTFTYTATDVNGVAETQTVTLTVTPVDDASDDAYTTAEDTAVSGDVSANDTYAGAVTYALATGPAHGSLVFNADGSFTYTPAADFNGVDSFTYTATDVNGVAETQTVTLTVTPVDDASDDAYTTAEDTAVSGDVSANDTFSGAVTYALGSGPAHGTVILAADGSFTYTPAADFNGGDSFTYTATDVNGVAETQTVTLTVTPVDDAADDAFTTAEDTPVSGDVSVNDTYAGAVTYAVATGPAHGSLVFNADGTFTYTPAADFNGVDSFTYTATDVNGVAETQTVTLTVTPVDDASDDAYTTAEDTAVSGDVSANDTFSGAVTYALGSGPAHGTVILAADGSFTYTPAADFNGGDSFTYTATDVNGVAETQTVTLTVTPVDDASDDAFTTAEDTAVGGDVSVNDTFSGAVTYAVATGPAHGTVILAADGSFTYTPAADFNGGDSFTYTATDVNGVAETQTVTLTVTPVDDASDDALTTAEDTAVSGDVSVNDTYTGAVTYAVAAGPAHGSLVFNADGSFTYTPAADFNGVDSFTYTATDVNGVAETQTVTLTVTPVDDASDDAFTTAEDTAVGGDVSVNDTFSGAVTYAVATGPAHGTVILAADGSFTYTPAADFNGTDTFTYTATDVNGVAETQTVTLTVTPVDDASDDALTTAEDTAVSGDVSVNDTYTGAVTYAVATGPAHGSLVFNADGTFTYTPAADFNGVDSFTYTATDVNGVAETQTVTLTVTPVDDASDDAYTTAEDTAVSGDVSANDTYAGAVAYALATGPAHGTVILAADGSFTYTPAADFNGTDTFTYTATDVNGVAETQTVTLTVTPVDDAADDAYTTAEDTAVSGDVSANDTYAGAVTYALGTGPAHGSLVFNADGTFTYTPAADFNGVDSFTYTATDVNGVAETQTVTLTVTPVDDASDDAYTTAEDTAVGGDVSANDTYAGAVAYALATGPAHGTVILAADGSFTYTPAADFNGVDTFTYTATDVNGVAETQTVTLTVTPVDDAADDAFTTAEDTAVSGDVSANDTYAGAVTYAVATGPAHGSLVFNADGTFTYTPAADFNGVDTFTYTATDVNGVAETQTVTLTVTPVDDASDDAFTTAEDTAVSGDVSANDTYAGAVTYAVATGPAHGSLVFNADGTFTYTPAADFNGVDTFTYTATDVNGVAETQTVTLTVTPVDDAADDAFTTAEDTAVSGDVSANDTYAGAVTYAVATGPAHGGLVFNADGSFTYTPAADFNGVDSFTYTATDVNGVAETQTVTLTVTPVDDASDDAYTTAEDTAVSGDVSVNDTYTGAVTYALGSGPAHGTVILAADGTFTYTPAADFNGVDTFTYTATDVNGVAETQTVTLTVTPVDDASDDAYTTAEDTAVGGDVSANDTFSGAVIYALGTGPAHGTVILAADGSFTYTPAADFNGVDTFTYTATDVNGVAETQTVTLTVTPANDAPVASDDNYLTSEDTALTVAVPGILGNDSDVDGDVLTVVASTAPAHGSVALNADGTFTYTPAANFHGVDSFAYTISDGSSATATATVTITVTRINDPPVARNDTMTITQDRSGDVAVLVNDSDIDGDPLTVTSVSSSNGTATVLPNGTLRYTPPPGFFGKATITYTITDGNGGFATATVTVVVEEVPAPTLVDDGLVAFENLGTLTPDAGKPLSVDGMVLDTVRSFGGFDSIAGSIGVDGMVLQTVNNVSALGSIDDVMPMSPATEPVPLSRADMWQIGARLESLGRDDILGASDPTALRGSALRLGLLDQDDVGSHDQVILQTLVHARTLIVQLSSTQVDPAQSVTQYRIMQGNGEPLPAWLEPAGPDMLIGELPADVAHVSLRVKVLYADGTFDTNQVRIEADSGEVSPIAQRDAGPLPPFHEQFTVVEDVTASEIGELANLLRSG